MPIPHRMLLAVMILGLLGPLHLPQQAQAGVTVQDIELINKRGRFGRSSSELQYRVTIDNVGTSLDNVKVYVSCDAPGVTLPDDIVEFGTIAENAPSTSTDVFSVRQSRRTPLDPACLFYEVGFETIVRLSGVVTDAPLANATVIGLVTRPSSGRPILDSGRPILDSFETTADENGNYTLEVIAVTEDDFITLEARGVGEQSNAVLTSTVGSVGSLQLVGASGSIIVNSGDAGALNVTHITTAQDELVRRLNGGVLPTTDAELSTLRSQVNGSELLELAAVIKTVIDNPGVVTLPPGVNNTLELIQDEQVFDDFLATIEADPALNDLLVQATVETADGLNIGFSPEEIPGRLYAVTRDEAPLRGAAYVFDFGVAGDGAVIFSEGSANTTWSLNIDGEIEVTLIDPPVTESFVFHPDATSPSGQVRAISFDESLRIVRLANGPVYDQVFILPTRRTTYPDDPIPDDITVTLPAPEHVYLAFREDGILPTVDADVAGDQIAAYYFHEGNNSVGFGGNDDILGADFLNFNLDGTGITSRRGFGFAWSTTADGRVDVNFDNGDNMQYVVFSETGDVAQTIGIGTLAATGESYTIASEAISYDGFSNFSTPNLENRRYRSVPFIYDPQGLPIFDYIFLPGGTGCRLVGSDENNVSSQPISWVSTALNRMDSVRPYTFDPTVVNDRRGWQAIDVDPGIFGDRYWVIENADFNLTGDNTYVFTDPEVTPGRINAYEFVENVAGQPDPCGFGPAAPNLIFGNIGPSDTFETSSGRTISHPDSGFFNPPAYSFVADGSGTLSTIELALSRSGIDGNVVVSLHTSIPCTSPFQGREVNCVGGDLPGATLGSWVITAPQSPSLVQIDAALSGIGLTAGTKYFIQVTAADALSQAVWWNNATGHTGDLFQCGGAVNGIDCFSFTSFTAVTTGAMRLIF